jgi:hypothetical protein
MDWSDLALPPPDLNPTSSSLGRELLAAALKLLLHWPTRSGSSHHRSLDRCASDAHHRHDQLHPPHAGLRWPIRTVPDPVDWTRNGAPPAQPPPARSAWGCWSRTSMSTRCSPRGSMEPHSPLDLGGRERDRKRGGVVSNEYLKSSLEYGRVPYEYILFLIMYLAQGTSCS